MNTPTGNDFLNRTSRSRSSDSGEAETTLRLIASLPAPHGLEDRVKAALQTNRRTGRVLPWPASLASGGRWMHDAVARGAAAAAIVFVVAGGGWGVYSRVQPPQTAKVIVMPHAATAGGFSSAGAMRTPQTLNVPVLARPAASLRQDAAKQKRDLAAKNKARSPRNLLHHRKTEIAPGGGK